MKIITWHADRIKVEPKKKAIDSAEKFEGGEIEGKNILVVLTSAEKGDNKNMEGIVKNYVKEIEDIYKQVKAGEVMLYPYVHLSSTPSKPATAKKILDKAYEVLQEKGYRVRKAPFGWYKSFDIEVKGHPLAELSREIKGEKRKSKLKEKEEDEKFFKFILIDKEGNEYEVNKNNWKNCKIWREKGLSYKRLKTFFKNEVAGIKTEKDEPTHIKLMKKLEMADYCDVSDVGHFKWFPKGNLIRDLILDYQEKLAKDYGAFKILNPLVYNLDDEKIRSLLGEFHEKDYSWEDNKTHLILRFASDPGAFPFMRKTKFSHKQLPVKEYEEAICFRKEQRGELSGLKRVRNFLMTDIHAFCEDEKQAKKEFEHLSSVCKDLMDSIISKGNWVLGWESTEKYYEKNKEWVKKMSRDMKIPSLVKLMKKRTHYYSMKNEFQAINHDGSNTQVSTVQIDHVNGERFEITYKGKNGKDHPSTIIHCSTFGSLERTVSTLLENAEIKGKRAVLPLWLSPTQVRLCPISDEFLAYCDNMAKNLEKENIRVDIDDRSESIGKKIRDSEQEWVPYTLVIGKKEKEKNKLVVRNRETGEKIKMNLNELIEYIKTKTNGFPYRPLPLAKRISLRPRFI